MARINTKTGDIIKEITFAGTKGEAELQGIIEKYLPQLLKAYLIRSKYKMPKGEIDTLALSEDGIPCIIEYKREKDESIINQIVFYYDWLSQQSTKAEFEKLKDSVPELNSLTVDWSQGIRLIVIAKSFSKWDESLIRHLNTDIEVYTYSYHENELDLHREKIGLTERKSPASTQRNITYEEHLVKADDSTKQILEELRTQVLNLGNDIEEGYTIGYIKYVVNTTFLSIHVYRTNLTLHLRVDEKSFTDPKKITKDISGRNWSVTREFKVESVEDIPYALELIKQAYEYQ
ncbi:MAG: hypothetical protein KJ697_04055 [Nanoarchaeota archaeon]|nr:hypothetical protein [Nanoarchaeota archaeon]MBU4123903.1 hypothetical protein [Nanoarchaeota archaeon]